MLTRVAYRTGSNSGGNGNAPKLFQTGHSRDDTSSSLPPKTCNKLFYTAFAGGAVKSLFSTPAKTANRPKDIQKYFARVPLHSYDPHESNYGPDLFKRYLYQKALKIASKP